MINNNYYGRLGITQKEIGNITKEEIQKRFMKKMAIEQKKYDKLLDAWKRAKTKEEKQKIEKQLEFVDYEVDLIVKSYEIVTGKKSKKANEDVKNNFGNELESDSFIKLRELIKKANESSKNDELMLKDLKELYKEKFGEEIDDEKPTKLGDNINIDKNPDERGI